MKKKKRRSIKRNTLKVAVCLNTAQFWLANSLFFTFKNATELCNVIKKVC
jgi:hypothetical protein